MDYSLSSVVKLADLNDYLAPAQECVPDAKPEKPELLKQKDSSGKASISLADCLACSGCVTTAEAVLMESQNEQALVDALQTHKVVLSLSAISEATLMAHWNVSSRSEFYERLRRALPEVDEVFSMDAGDAAHSYEVARDGGLISSHCPGVVLYAEKTFEASSMVPLINRAAPTEVWQGALVKSLASIYKDPRWALCRRSVLATHSPSFVGVWQGPLRKSCDLQLATDIYHVAVSSCMDKKIPRPEFGSLVDLSLTTGEFLNYLESSTRPAGQQRLEPPMWWSLPHRLAWVYGVAAWAPYHLERASGGMAADYIDQAGTPLVRKMGYNADHVIYEGATGQLHVASGLRNLKNMSKQKQIDHQTVLLACPKGCFSGAGQAVLYKSTAGFRQRAEAIYQSMPRWRVRDLQTLCGDAKRVLGMHLLYQLHQPPSERPSKPNAW